jgi:EpsI family protein
MGSTACWLHVSTTKEAAVPDTNTSPRVSKALLFAFVMMLAAAGAAYALKPRHMIADDKAPVVLNQIVPSSFGDWSEDNTIPQITVDPTVQARLDSLYSQTLNRTYVNSQGERILVSIAYGKNQNSQSTAVHRPEFCYNAQGFHIENKGYSVLDINGRKLKTVRLLADRDERIEPITYWVTLSDEAIVPGIERKLAQLRYGLRGQIADGMLVRISSLTTDKARIDFDGHQRFLVDLEAALPADMKSRFLGS